MADELANSVATPGRGAVQQPLPRTAGNAVAAVPSWTQSPSPSRRELLAVILLVALCDVTMYRGQGFAGYALLFAVAPWLVMLGAVYRSFGAGTLVVGALTTMLVAKTLWCGSTLLVALGFTLLTAWAMCLAGQIPYILELVVFSSQTIRSGFEGLVGYGRTARRLGPSVTGMPSLNLVMPLFAFLVFGLIFLLANPDLIATFSDQAVRILNRLREWLLHFSLGELLFWAIVVWLAVGLLRPLSGRGAAEMVAAEVVWVPPYKPAAAPLYAAFRNTLVTVIALFAGYLLFEFQTLWFRTFPPGFYYSGYAHEGAAWLTVALALATLTLSLVFRGSVLHDPRQPRLRRLAWIWSAENLILALAVYHRMFIYIGFNGMTRMRVVGMFGITVVVVGFVLVIGKIVQQREFIWLLRHQLWALALATYLFALTPVDSIVVGYNVRRILSGDPAPSVQICVHPISSEGLLLLRPLLQCDNRTIQEGVRALLAGRDDQSQRLAAQRRQLGWTAFQIADSVVAQGLSATRHEWADRYATVAEREAAFRRFYEYAYQWY